ncbi:hypothetical protein BY996DRAFT_4579952 [Phakopsora pachyrhizi]|nr:hypothetical protein BY996DRAFT_4579952 [Phakopsora pachyrhizi]
MVVVDWRLKELWSRIRDLQGKFFLPTSKELLEETVLISEALLILAEEKISSFFYNKIQTIWRQLYTDSTLIKVSTILSSVSEYSEIFENVDWYGLMKLLDMALIVSGVPGRGRREATFFLIKKIQKDFINTKSLSNQVESSIERPLKKPRTIFNTYDQKINSQFSVVQRSIQSFELPPSDESFSTELYKKPFVIKKYCKNWPALKERPWKDLNYLRASTGPGRFVPVEIGRNYSDDDWGQKIMSWYEFLNKLEFSGTIQPEIVYLAQYNLFNQFPSLKDDMVIPSYTDCQIPSEVGSKPESEDGLLLNAWLGPSGTISPAHTDPYYNCYAQIVGKKYVWVAPPGFYDEMYPFGKVSGDEKSLQSNFMNNTSQVDIFEKDLKKLQEKFPQFVEQVLPQAMQVVLEEGDMLVMPPGWWHSMKSLETSMNISIWF